MANYWEADLIAAHIPDSEDIVFQGYSRRGNGFLLEIEKIYKWEWFHSYRRFCKNDAREIGLLALNHLSSAILPWKIRIGDLLISKSTVEPIVFGFRERYPEMEGEPQNPFVDAPYVSGDGVYFGEER
jgi:hypothetical protein